MDRGYSLFELLVTLVIAALVLGFTLPPVGTDAPSRDELLRQEFSKPIVYRVSSREEEREKTLLPAAIARLMESHGYAPPGVSCVGAELRALLAPGGTRARARRVAWGNSSRRLARAEPERAQS
jgi:prepilin-type N-terminal cleavage/methylation domain-containing protein